MVLLSALEEDFLTAIEGTARSGADLLRVINACRARAGISPLGVGSLYPTLHRMAADGLIEELPKPDSQPKTRIIYYQPTAEGKRRLEQIHTYRGLLAVARPGV